MALTILLCTLSLKAKSLSLGRLDEQGCKILLQNGILTIHDQKGCLVTKVKKSVHQSYLLQLDVVERCLVMKNYTSWLWHKGYGHMNFVSLRPLNSQEILRGILSLKEPLILVWIA